MITGGSAYTGNTEIQRGDLYIVQGGTLNNSHIYVGVGDVLARFSIWDIDGGTIVDEPITVNSSAAYYWRVIGGNNTSGENEFSGTVTLGGPGSLYAESGGTIKFSGAISGARDIYLTGHGTVKMAAANTYTGKTYVNSGKISIAAETGLGGNPSTLVADQLKMDGGTLKATASFAMDDSNRGITIGAADGTFEVDSSQTLTINSVIAGASGGDLSKTGAGTLTLAGVNTYSGATTISEGILTVGGAGQWGSGTYAGNITDNAVLNYNSTAAQTLSGIISGTGNLEKRNSGILTLTGANTFQYGPAIYAGEVKIGSGGSLTAGDAYLGDPTTPAVATKLWIESGGVSCARRITVNAGDAGMRVVGGLNSSGTATFSADLTLSSGGVTLTANASGGTVAFTGVISGAYPITKDGAGIVKLSGANTYSGATTVNAGTLKLGAAGVIPHGSGKGDVTVTDTTGGDTLDLGGYAETINGLSGAGYVDNTVAGGPYTLTVGDNNADSSFSGAIKNTAGTLALSKTGSGTLTLSGANTYRGQTIIKTGNLVATKLADAGATSSSLGAPGIANSIIKIGAPAGSFGQLVYTSMSDSSTDRQIQVGDGSVPGDSGTAYVQNTSIGAITFSASPFNAADTAATATRIMTLTGASTTNNTVSGVMQDNNTGNGGIISLRKEGSGKWILGSGASTFTGKASIRRGVLSVGKLANANSNSSLGTGVADPVIQIGYVNLNGGGTLEYTGTGDTTSRQIQIGGGADPSHTSGATINNNGTGVLTFNASPFNAADSSAGADRTLTLGGTHSGKNTISGAIVDQNGKKIALVKADAGTWILSGANSYSGATTVNAGTLGGAGCSSSATTVKSGATIAPGTSIGTFNTGSASFEAGSIVDWEYDDTTADLVAAGPLSFATGANAVTVTVKKIGSVVNGERTLFTFSGRAPDVESLAFDLTGAPGVTVAEAYPDGPSIKVLLLPEPGVLALAGLALVALRKKLKS
ncbi:MAG: autotransporter-associated beta strand repeat-containing protein [bacterium]|nr:autotransporter-associated beta strand repeat-containing protein [bacterium]